MSTIQDYQQWAANNKLDVLAPSEFGDISSETSVGWLDMRDYEGIYFAVTCDTISTGSTLTQAKVQASDGLGNKVDIDSHDSPTDVNAAGDTIGIEVSAEQIAQEGASEGHDLRYVTLKAISGDATDRHGVVKIRYGARHAEKDLTSDTA